MHMKSALLYTPLAVLGILVAVHFSSSSKVGQKEIKSTETLVTNSETGIKFIEEDWKKALKTAQGESKLVFLDIYATWCGPCKMLKQYTFKDAGVAEFFNKNFINVSVDGEKGVGPDLAKQYAIEGYPTLVVADHTGKPVLMTAGYIPADVLMKFANEALKRGGKQAKK